MTVHNVWNIVLLDLPVVCIFMILFISRRPLEDLQWGDSLDEGIPAKVYKYVSIWNFIRNWKGLILSPQSANLDPDEAPKNVTLHLRSKLFDTQIIYQLRN